MTTVEKRKSFEDVIDHSNNDYDEVLNEEFSDEETESVEDDEIEVSDQEEVLISPRTANRADASKLFFKVIEVKERKPKNYFVVLYFEEKKVYKSKTTKKSTEWIDQGRFLPISDDTNSIKISLFQKSLLNSPRGTINLNLEEFIEGYPYNRWYKLEGKKTIKGYLHLQMMLTAPNKNLETEFSHPLHTFIERKRHDLLEKLVEEPFTNFTTCDAEGRSALHLAVELNDLESLNILLKSMDPKVATKLQDKNGNTALHWACLHNAGKEIIETLINSKFEHTTVNKNNETPLHCAAEGDNVPAIDVLISKGAKVNSADKEKNTPLATALLKHSPNAVRALIRHKSNIYKKNNRDISVWELAQRRELVNTEPRKIFMEELNAHDPREFVERKQYDCKKYAIGKKVSVDYLESTQFSLTVEKRTEVVILISSPDLSPQLSSNSTFALTKSHQGIHNEPDYSRDTIAFGNINPLRTTLLPGYFYNVIPIVKSDRYEDEYILLVLHKEGDDCKITELQPWKYVESIEGEWSKKNAGGALHNTSWTENPQYELILPEKDNIRFLIYLSQEKNDPELRIPKDGELRKLPYQFNIGFILLDKSGKPIDQTEKFINARGVHKEFVLDCSKSNKWKIVPATWNPGEESNFTLKVFCDEPFKLVKK